jgi:hypothetical protein
MRNPVGAWYFIAGCEVAVDQKNIRRVLILRHLRKAVPCGVVVMVKGPVHEKIVPMLDGSGRKRWQAGRCDPTGVRLHERVPDTGCCSPAWRSSMAHEATWFADSRPSEARMA